MDRVKGLNTRSCRCSRTPIWTLKVPPEGTDNGPFPMVQGPPPWVSLYTFAGARNREMQLATRLTWF